MRTVIENRQEFERYLVEAIAKMKALIVNEPDDKTLKAVLRQLEAIQQWTANGQTMTRGQVAKIVMGLQAHREMGDFPVEQDLVLALNNYIESDDVEI
ncbi:MAG TPA: hypothetical protein VG963_26285 [Polyangiaceae bacterium]|nr:hypothetical protein [Polyangiaceae bacterium]